MVICVIIYGAKVSKRGFEVVQSKQIFSSPIPYAKGMLSVLTMARARRYDHLGVTCNILGAGLRDLKEHGMYSCAKKKLIFLVGLLFSKLF